MNPREDTLVKRSRANGAKRYQGALELPLGCGGIKASLASLGGFAGLDAVLAQWPSAPMRVPPGTRPTRAWSYPHGESSFDRTNERQSPPDRPPYQHEVNQLNMRCAKTKHRHKEDIFKC
jgi:hypothetical protein